MMLFDESKEFRQCHLKVKMNTKLQINEKNANKKLKRIFKSNKRKLRYLKIKQSFVTLRCTSKMKQHVKEQHDEEKSSSQ